MCEFEVKKGTLKKYTGNGGHVVIPDGVKSIVKSVFKGRKDLQSIVIPEGITVLPTEAFAGCTSLTSVELPHSIESIGYRAFYKTPWLESLGEFAMVHDILLAYQGRNKKVVIPAEVTKINSYAFEKNKTVQEIMIPESVKTIGDYAFRGCSKLKKIVLPENITSISVSMFENCTALENIAIPKSVTEIGGGAFAGCTRLKEIVIPEGVSRVGGFEGCSGLKKVSLPNSITEIGWSAFQFCSSLQSISLPDSITKLGAWAFSSCGNLQSISLPDSISEMEGCVFSCCSNLQSVSLPKHMKLIPNGTFSSCDRLTNVTIPDGVTTIEAYAFAKCHELRSIVIPQSVKEIKGTAFAESGLQYIEIPESVVSLGEKAFKGTNMQYVVLPDAITDWTSLGISEGTIVKHTSNGYDHSSEALHIIEQCPEWLCYPVEIEKWLKAKKKERYVKLDSSWIRTKEVQSIYYHVAGWCAFRGPTFIIDQLLNDLEPKDIRNREDYSNGITQIEISPSVVICHEQGSCIVGNNLVTEKVLEKYAVLQFACFQSSGGQEVLYSVSGDSGLTRSEIIDGAKNEGDHWVIQHSPLENVNESTYDTRTGETWMSNYTFPFAHEWLSPKICVNAQTGAKW